MKTSTARQMINAEAAVLNGAPRNWVVKSGVRADALAASEPMTYRQAVAQARAARERAHYAIVERAA